MFRSVFRAALWERRLALVWYAVGMAGLVGVTTGVYPTVREGSGTITRLMENLPQGLLSMMGSTNVAELLSPAGFINSRVNASIGAVVLTTLAISAGTAAIAGEEDRKTMDLLLANPLPRIRIVLERFAAMVVLVGAVATAILVVMAVANPIVDLGFSLGNMLASNFELALLALVFGSLALAAGGLTGRRGTTIGVASGVTVATFFINGLAGLVSWLQPPQKLTPFYWLQRSDPLANGLSYADSLLMIAVIGVFLLVAAWGFEHRDVTM
jgi:ABC-2 type transport system permease protein